VLVWLTLPLVGGLMLRADYRHYMSDAATQKQAVGDWQSYYRIVSKDALHLSKDVTSPYTFMSLPSWRRRLKSYENDNSVRRDLLYQGTLSHYPATAEQFEQIEELSDQQYQALVDAAAARENYERLGDSVRELEQQLVILEQYSRYYEVFGEWEMYQLVQSELAKAEAASRQRRQKRNDTVNELQALAHKVETTAGEIAQRLDRLDVKIDEDESLTYAQNLKTRLLAFDLKGELRTLIVGESRAGTS
jgi:hypothetical protein